jgi:hypothetical protein
MGICETMCAHVSLMGGKYVHERQTLLARRLLPGLNLMVEPSFTQRLPTAPISDVGLARIFWIAVALAGASAAYAISGARDLVYDGSFYLLGISAHGAFQLFEPGRVSVQLLQQGFAVSGAWLGIHDLWTLGRLFSLGASGWPIVLTALCWFVLPRAEKSWIVGPLLNLVLAIPVTSFIGVGEGVIASCLLWLAFLLAWFHIDRSWGALAAIVAAIACAFSHESAILCLVLIAALAASQVRNVRGFARAAAIVVAVVTAAGSLYMVRWIVFPRSATERSDFLVSLLGGFLGTPRAPNLSALASLAAAPAILLSQNRRLRAAAAGLCLALLALLLLLLVAMPGDTIAPSRFFAARGLPVALTTLIAFVFLLMKWRGLSPAQFANPPLLAVLFGLCVFQPLAQAMMTENWNAYVQDLREVLGTRQGIVTHTDAMHTLDADGTRFRRELLESWSVEPLSIVLAPHGRVAAVVEPAPMARWTPYRLDDPAALPQAPGLDWSGFESVHR